jgi:hypothetical protein
MPISNKPVLTREAFLSRFGHPRKVELATMILDRAPVDDLTAAGFGRLNVMEMARDIKLNVEGYGDLRYDIPRGSGMDSTTAEDVARTAEADEAEKKESPSVSQGSESSPASVQAQPAGDSSAPDAPAADAPKGDATGSTEGQGTTTAPSGDEVPGVTAEQSNVETLGGHPVGTLTGEEDAAALQAKADEEKANQAGDAA